MHPPEHLDQPSNVGLSVPAKDRKAGMTLDELGSLVTQAHRLGTPGDAPVFGEVSMGGRVRALHVRPEKRRSQQGDQK